MNGDETEMRSLGEEGRLHGGNMVPYVEEYCEHLGRTSIDCSEVVHSLLCPTLLLFLWRFLPPARRYGAARFEDMHCREINQGERKELNRLGDFEVVQRVVFLAVVRSEFAREEKRRWDRISERNEVL